MPAIKKLGQLFKSDKDKDKEKNKDKRSGSDGVGGGIGRLGVENVLRKEYPRHSTNRRTEEDEDVLEDSDAAPAPDVPRHSRDRGRGRDRDRDTMTSSNREGHHHHHHNKLDDSPWSYRNSGTFQRPLSHQPPPEPDLKEIPPLQSSSDVHTRGLEPLSLTSLDPDGFDLAPPPEAGSERDAAAAANQRLFPLERRALLLFSTTHLRLVFEDIKLLRKFSEFLVESRPEYVPLMLYHLEVRKALAAIGYANAVAASLKPLDGKSGSGNTITSGNAGGHANAATTGGLFDFSKSCAPNTENEVLRAKAAASFEALANEALPAWITSVWMRAVEVSIRKRINGSLPAQLWDMSEGLAEAFCLSDPSRHDCPILFASDEFNKTTLYSNKYLIGRNCRLLQGPHTNPHSRRRVREKLASGEKHYEPILNYRRDGSPFMNLLMITPLLDAKGKVRYFLGAQVDTSGLLEDFYGFEYLRAYMEREDFDVDELLSDAKNKNKKKKKSDDNSKNAISQPFSSEMGAGPGTGVSNSKAKLQNLSELFDRNELEVIRQHGGRLRHPSSTTTQGQPGEVKWKKGRLVLHADGGNELYEHDNATEIASNQGESNSVVIVGGLGGGGGAAAQTAAAASSFPTPWDDDGTNNVQRHHHANAANGAVHPNGDEYAGSTNLSAAEASTLTFGGGGSESVRVSSDGGGGASGLDGTTTTGGGHLGGAYDRYLLVRPAPHLRILFASPSLRIPGLVQSNLMDRIGGSAGMRQQIEAAMYQGQSVTAKIRWVTGNLSSTIGGSGSDGSTGGGTPARQRGMSPQQQQHQSYALASGCSQWMHATPLLGREGEVGVWMVVLVDDEPEPMPVVGGISVSSSAQAAVPSGGGGIGGLLTPGTLPGLGSVSSAAPARRVADRLSYNCWPNEAISPERDGEGSSLRGGAATDGSSIMSTIGL